VGLYPADDAAAALRAYRTFTETQPDDVHVLASLRTAGAGGWIPPRLTGSPVLELSVVCSADDPASVAGSAALFETLPPAASDQRWLSHLELQSMADQSGPAGRRYYTKSGYLAELADGTAELLVEAAVRTPSPLSSIDVEFMRGAITATTDAESAFPQRDAPFMCTAWASWVEPADDMGNVAWSRTTIEALKEWKHRGGYSNYMLQDELPSVVSEMYGSTTYARLMQVKKRYDPENLFRVSREIVTVPSRLRSQRSQLHGS
jgi:hypothetical protein